jgi:carbon monoxide dehydrogenase subunit G
MIDYKSELIVNKPVAEVFSFVTDVTRYDDWTDMTGTHLVSGQGLKLGSQIETTLKLGPSKQTMTFEVWAFEPNRKLGWKTTSKGSLAWNAEFLFEPTSDGTTRVTSSGSIQLNGALRLIEPLMAGEVRSGEAKELVKFKELLESK